MWVGVEGFIGGELELQYPSDIVATFGLVSSFHFMRTNKLEYKCCVTAKVATIFEWPLQKDMKDG